jgi:phospholipid/cholesterol/gamma-HCH transport system substrate-binding protein
LSEAGAKEVPSRDMEGGLRERLPRIAGFAALVAAAVVIVLVLFTGGSTYVLHAEFSDAGQLVGGDLVTIAGHQVGSIGSISVTNNGLADVELDVSDSSITPVRQGTIATIGQLSLTGVANRFVGLSLGAGAPIKSGGTLPLNQTRGIVDLDVLLNALTPRVRTSLQRIIKTGAYFVGQPTASQINRSVQYFNPALSQATQLGAEVVADKFALDRLISSTAQVSTALAARNSDLGGAVTSTAAWLREVASQRAALEDAITRAPAVLHQGTGVLADVNFTLKVLDPVLRDLQPVAPRLGTLLRTLVPAAKNAIPTISGIQALVPGAEKALTELPPVERVATPAVRSLTAALRPITPILAGLRPYAPDLIAGFFNGVGGAAGGAYDANGHYLRTLAAVSASGATLTGVLGTLGSLLGGVTGALTGIGSGRTGLVAPCPGGGSPPASDGTNPWTSPDLLPGTGSLCNPANDQQ